MECGKTKGRREEERKRKAEELEWKRRKKKGSMVSFLEMMTM